MSTSYQIPDLAPGETHSAHIMARRSRFLATLAHCASIEKARSFIQGQRQLHAGATHNCWAFCAGPPGDTARIAYSDDGEPHGTAGRPMLTVLLHSGVGEIACVVSRRFGGVKLGTAGLARAYQDSVRASLANLPLRLRVETVAIRVRLNYKYIGALQRGLHAREARICREEFTDAACFHIVIPKEHLELFSQELDECSAGSAIMEVLPPP